jgi:predicted MFS family arabinose efflux permease
MGWLVVSAIVLDFSVAANLTLGQRAIFALGPASRGRLNGLYTATFIVGGGVGSAVGGWAFAHGDWSLTTWIGFSMPVAALAYFATER